jgi:type II secretion system protein H
MSPTGHNPTRSSAERRGRGCKLAVRRGLKRGFAAAPGFTLIELILVMSILVIVLAVSSPSLSRFFRGRTLDSEAKRFLALTRYGQSRAVSEGVPAELWIDAKQGEYGLRLDSSYVDQDTKELRYQVHTDVKVDVQQSTTAQKLATVWKGRPGLGANVPKIRFTPDGFISPSSPDVVAFKQGDEAEIWIGPDLRRVNYQILTNQVQLLQARQ